MILLSGGHTSNAVYRLDEDEKRLYARVAAGEKVVGHGNGNDRVTLLRLRRNGLIDNYGTRSRPDYRLSERWRKKRFVVIDIEDDFWMWV